MATTRETKGAKPRLSRDALATWRSLQDLTDDLRRILSSELLDSGLSPADYAVLLALSEAPDRALRSSELADKVDWERSRLSHHLARMQRRDLIRRDPCATDSRGAVVVLTEDGLAALRSASGPHLRAVKYYFADALTDEQITQLGVILAAIRRNVDDRTAQ
ncbi:MarR family winged helix-turn-helix transcriptional regulator [Streptomyces sp. 35G-GA-8]|uniref:MarR family winged helix-turn-helix transcriptional regulator n=1 Tax=Streptomyces sp. 35G-GA-8 TaxID=2939434 RepID=UPI00201F56DD|nr:MarR family transcriptional regulator [Streptomyces sp. 35G-GA-8]MCL7382603.1 MarR family transcriptional regulator [Streptomyces sp. 35G-GA-8]